MEDRAGSTRTHMPQAYTSKWVITNYSGQEVTRNHIQDDLVPPGCLRMKFLGIKTMPTLGTDKAQGDISWSFLMRYGISSGKSTEQPANVVFHVMNRFQCGCPLAFSQAKDNEPNKQI